MFDNNEFDVTEDIIETEDDITLEEIDEAAEDAEPEAYEPSEFERELENYLPTAENTTKVKQPLPGWVVSAIASALVCVFILSVYSVLIMPLLRPRTIITYSGEKPQTEHIEEDKTPIEKAADSVVTITGTTAYRSFFGITSSKSNCSGLVLTEDGYILTANSVLGQEGISVKIDNKDYPATVHGTDASKDIAIIKIDKTGLTPATLGDSDHMKMGTSVISLGNVLGENMGTSATRGIICGVNRDMNINGRNFSLLQTDAETGSGSAGGPIINMAGEVVGMITNAVTTENSNISFAIPSNDIKAVAESLITTGKAPEGLIIGITGTDTDHGVVIDSVMEDTPAEKAGLKVGDLILRADDTTIKSISDLNKIRDTHRSGEKIKLSIYRDGELLEIEVTL